MRAPFAKRLRGGKGLWGGKAVYKDDLVARTFLSEDACQTFRNKLGTLVATGDDNRDRGLHKFVRGFYGLARAFLFEPSLSCRALYKASISRRFCNLASRSASLSS
jgi:hypothetical protein